MNFPQMTLKEATIRRWVGSGRRHTFDHQGEPLTFTVNHCESVSTVAFRPFHTAYGPVHLLQPETFFQLISDIPLFPEAMNDPESWFFELVNARMMPGFRALFRFFEQPEETDAEFITVRFTVVIKGQSSEFISCVTLSLLDAWMTSETFNPVPLEWWDGMPLFLPLRMGKVGLSLGRVRVLSREDVLILNDPLMTIEGEGILHCGKIQFFYELEPEQENSHQYFMAIKSKQGPHMTQHENDEPMNENDVDPVEADLIEMPQGEEFNDLPLDLTIRCGHVSLTLGELRNLDAGSTLLVDHVTPGEALLCHGNYLLAKGELVNIDGSLGLQIKSLFRNAPV